MKKNDFANKLTDAWDRESSKSNFSEIQQFRALIRSFKSLEKDFDIEEFHGMKHQVIFNGKGSWGRSPARCEISDLLVVIYNENTSNLEVRVTFIQAKKSNDKHNYLCRNWQKITTPIKFQANLEQWDLLSRRPHVIPHKPFKCPPEILNGAILPSVGSIIVFHKKSKNNYNFFYMSADILSPVTAPKGKYAKLQVLNKKLLRNISGHDERVFACCVNTFAQSLYNFEIGTPIHHEPGLSPREQIYRDIFRDWINSVISSHISVTNEDEINNTKVSRQLLEKLNLNPSDDLMKNPPKLLVLRSGKNDKKKQ